MNQLQRYRKHHLLCLSTLGICLMVLGGCGRSQDKALAILCIGDSITQADSETVSWRYHLWKGLVDGDFQVDFLGTSSSHFQGTPEFEAYKGQEFDPEHEAEWGVMTSAVAQRISGRLEGLPQEIDFALIHLGTNDALVGRPPENIIGSLSAIIAALRAHAPQVKIIVAQIAEPGTPRAIPQFNAQLPAAMATLSTAESPVAVADCWQGFNPDEMTWDGLHPNWDGEIFIAERFLLAMEPLFD